MVLLVLQDHWRPCAFSATAMYETEPFEASHDTVMLFDEQEVVTFSWVGGHAAGGVRQNQSVRLFTRNNILGFCVEYNPNEHK